MTETNNCPNCRQPVRGDAHFCSVCGSPTAMHEETQVIGRQGAAPGSPVSHSLVGRVLDSKYEIIERLGEGGMGAVYRARRLHIGDEVAVKVLHPQYVLNPSAVERFRREARSAAMMRHPKVVTIHDFSGGGAEGSPAYIVMELVQGISLRDLLNREKRLPPQRALTLMSDICAGVGFGHHQGVVHRDLKPDNIIVVAEAADAERESAKVVDFGIAKLRDASSEFSLTQTGATVGTPYYMSPEQCRGEPLDPRSDVYSLGAMLYEMLAGGPPFNATSLGGLIAKHLNEAPPDLPSYLGPALISTCQRALSKNPDDRPPDASALGRELQNILVAPDLGSQAAARSLERTTLQVEPFKRPAIQAEPPTRSSRWLTWAAVGLVLLLVSTGVIFVVLKRADESTNGYNQTNLNRSGVSDVHNSASQDVASGREINVEQSAGTQNARGLQTIRGLTGKWTGTYGPMNQPAVLVVQDDNGGKLSGVLEQGRVRVAFTGRVDPSSRQVTLQETRVLSGEGWSLGKGTGELSSDGRTMSGTGTDAAGAQLGFSYEWSFTRQ